MPNYMIEGQTLTDIADAIRAKTGSSDPITGANMASEIENIPTGSTIEGVIADNISQNIEINIEGGIQI